MLHMVCDTKIHRLKAKRLIFAMTTAIDSVGGFGEDQRELV